MREKFKRASIKSCSEYAERYRVIKGKPWSTYYHPWTVDMMNSNAYRCVSMKGAQLGVTEVVLNRTFYVLDILEQSVGYFLPNQKPDAAVFSASRFDPALEESPHLNALFAEARNVDHKRAGRVSLYVRGARSRAGFKSFPAGELVFDEYDEMNLDLIALALQRLSGQQGAKQIWMLSTPTIPDFGIHQEYQSTNQQDFIIQAPCCSKHVALVLERDLVVTADAVTDPKIRESHLKCPGCGNKLPQPEYTPAGYAKGAWDEKAAMTNTGVWTPTVANTDPDLVGFHINQAYSCTQHPAELADYYIRGQTEPMYEQEFYNSMCGKPHLVADAKLTEEEIREAQGTYTQLESAKANGAQTMGVDVNAKDLHCCIIQWEPEPRLIKVVKCSHSGEVHQLMKTFQVSYAVIDSMPERRMSLEFCRQYGNEFARMCSYSEHKYLSIEGDNDHDDGYLVTVNRTMWLDDMYAKIRTKTLALPQGLDQEFRSNMRHLVRVPMQDKNGNPTARYQKTGPDHYAHAMTYAVVARKLALTSVADPIEIRS